MLLYCLKCNKNMKSKNLRVEKMKKKKKKNGRIILSSNCALSGSKK